MRPLHVTSVLPVDFSMIPPEKLKAAQVRGTHVHLATHYLDTVGLNWDTVHAQFRPRVEQWERFKEATGWVTEASEFEVLDEARGYVGHPDRAGYFTRLARRFNRKKTILDIKTGFLHPATGLQTAAYAKGDRKVLRCAVNLTGEGEIPLLKWYEDPTDYHVFLAYLTARKWELKVGLKKLADFESRQWELEAEMEEAA